MSHDAELARVAGSGNPLRAALRHMIVSYSVRSRRRKADAILAWMHEHRCETVLLVGAASSNSAANVGIVEDAIADAHTIKMGINLDPQETPYPFTVADGRDMPFEDGYVDFALANAIIEHVGQEPEQHQLVKEMTRVARCWVITTPNLWFPVEAHTSVIFRHWSPAWRRRHEFHMTRLLSKRQFRALLPTGATIKGHVLSPTFTAFYDGRQST